MSVFPDDLDSDLEIARIENNVSEIGGDVLNSLRDAVFAIQRVLGINAQGNKPSLTSRINVSLDADGNIKPSSLEGIGLATLPITNSHVGDNAAVQESKLDLDFGTQYLKNLISSARTDLDAITASVSSQGSGLNLHILGLGNYHDGYHIKINSGTQIGVAGMASITVGDAINELSTRLFSGSTTTEPHIDLNVPSTTKHAASGISVDSSDFVSIDQSISTVQGAIDALDSGSNLLIEKHVDELHANGIIKNVRSYEFFNSDRRLIGPVSGVTYASGGSVVTLTGETSLSSYKISVGDVLVIHTMSGVLDVGAFQVRAIGPLAESDTLGDLPSLLANQVAVFHIFSETKASGDGVSASIYKPGQVSSEYAPLACGIRPNETMVDTISVVRPDAARVVSVGFNGAILAADGYDVKIKVGLGNSTFRELIITDLNYDRIGTNKSNPVNSEHVAERINAFVSDPNSENHFPITAAGVGNELVIAHDLVGPEYTIEIMEGFNGNYPLGLDAYGADVAGNVVVGNLNCLYNINGTGIRSIATKFTGTASINSATGTFSVYNSDGQLINPLNYGIGPGSVIHILDHQTTETNGSYTVLTATTTSISVFLAEQIDAPTSPTTFTVEAYESHVSLNSISGTETDNGTVQIFVDEDGRTQVHQRISYGTSFGSAFEIVSISNTFPEGTFSILIDSVGSLLSFNLLDDSFAGDTVSVDETFTGGFKLYHPNGLDYITIHIEDGSVVVGTETLIVSSAANDDYSLLLCTANFNGDIEITNLVDGRLFGNIGADQVRDDFIEVFSQLPISDLRSDGVVRGFDLVALTYADVVTGMQALPLRGGVAYVDGVRVSVETQKVIVNSFNDDETLINGDRIVAINNFGSIEVLQDSIGEMLTDGYYASSSLGKLLPLYKVSVVNGEISTVIDIRRFINDLDSKLDLVVDETNNVVGNFRSLEGALLFAESYPNREHLTVRILNSVHPTRKIVVPNGVSLVGGLPFGGGRHKIINQNNLNAAFIELVGNNFLKNIEISSSTAGLQGPLVKVSGSNVEIDNCLIQFNDIISSNSGDIGIEITAESDIVIRDTKINNVYIGISGTTGTDNLLIKNNSILGVSGVGLSYAVYVGSSSREIDNLNIIGNTIGLDNTDNTDLRGIFIDIGESIGKATISGNKIVGELNVLSTNNVSNGIRIINTLATGNVLSQAIIHENYIENVKLLDSSVFGIYIEDVSRVSVSNNTLVNVATFGAPYSDTGFIWIDDSVGIVDVHNNLLNIGEALRGIYVKGTSTITSILGNTLSQIGDANNATNLALPYSAYILGNSARASVVSNTFIGPGDYGIWWKGERSKISGNHFSTPDSATNYAFKIGIKAQASYLDISDNMLVGFTDTDSMGIVNVSTANEGVRISNNTIDGDEMANLIKLSGDYHVISGNRLKNSTQSSVGGTTQFIEFSSDADSISVVGNTFEGKGTSFIYSTYAITNASILNNTMYDAGAAMLTGAPITLSSASVADCFISGNKLPDISHCGAENTIGASPSQFDYNTNTIGFNKGLLDSISLHASAGVTGYDSTVSGDGKPFWTIVDGGTYWQLNNTDKNNCYLYFPINCLPNGSVIKSAQIQGRFTTQAAAASITARIFKRSVNLIDTSSPVQPVSDPITISINGEFVNTTSTGTIDEISGGEISEVINYSESAYYVQIYYLCSNTSSASGIQIRGITVNFRH